MMQKKMISDKNSLYAICSDYMATTLIKIAELYPESKDAIMDEILADPKAIAIILANTNKKSDVFDLCKAYPHHTHKLMQELSPEIYVSDALKAFKLIDKDKFNYADFAAVFPTFAEELFSMNNVFEKVIPHSFVLEKILRDIPQYRNILIDQLLKQSDAFLQDFFSKDWIFLNIAEHCHERRDALFQRYFSLFSDNSEITVEKLLDLTQKKDEYKRNTFGIINLEKLFNLFPEHKSALMDRLCQDPTLLHILLDLNTHIELDRRFLKLFELAPEYKDRLLAALQLLTAVPGVLGAFTHGVVDPACENHTWWHSNLIMSLCDLFPERAENFIQQVFTNETVLAKILSHYSMKFRQAFELAIKFPQFKKQIINAMQHETDKTQNFNITDALIETAHDDLKGVLKVLQSIYRSDSDFEKQALFCQILAYPDLVNLSLQLIQDNAQVETKNVYADTHFPEEMWPWLDLLISRGAEHSFILCCQLFPDYAVELIKFSLKNELFHAIFTKDIDNIIYAVNLAPELKETILNSIKSLDTCSNDDIDKLFAIFPENIPKIIALLFKDNFTFFRNFIDFAHRYPQYQTMFLEQLKSHPEGFLEILASSRYIYPLFVLYPNRRLLVETFCTGAKMSEDKLALLDNITTALSVLPEYIKHFLNYLFEIPRYPEVFCSYSVCQSLNVLHGHEQNILLLLCSFPQVIDKLKCTIDHGATIELFNDDIRALMNCCHKIFHQVLLNNINLDLDFKHIKPSHRGCIVKFIERLIAAKPKNEETLAQLKALRNKAANLVIPRLEFLALTHLAPETEATLSQSVRYNTKQYSE